jgi:hypothetical protein
MLSTFGLTVYCVEILLSLYSWPISTTSSFRPKQSWTIVSAVSKCTSKSRFYILEYLHCLRKRSPYVSCCKQHVIRILFTQRHQDDASLRADGLGSLYYSRQQKGFCWDIAVYGDRQKWRSGCTHNLVYLHLRDAQFKSRWVYLLSLAFPGHGIWEAPKPHSCT